MFLLLKHKPSGFFMIDFPMTVTLRPTISLPQPAVCYKSCLIVRPVGSASLFGSRILKRWDSSSPLLRRRKLKEQADQASDVHRTRSGCKNLSCV